jgi:hypothetical protein
MFEIGLLSSILFNVHISDFDDALLKDKILAQLVKNFEHEVLSISILNNY